MPSRKTKPQPAIADPYTYVLRQMARGCALKTEDYYRQRVATLSGHAIPAEIVAELCKRKLIESRNPWDKGINGKFLDYALTPAGRSASKSASPDPSVHRLPSARRRSG
jgi:hypothetical protein